MNVFHRARSSSASRPSGAARFVLASVLAVLAAASIPDRPAAQSPASIPVDNGTFRVWSGDRAVGAEVFSYTLRRDSLMIESEYSQALRGGDTLRKSVSVVVDPLEFDLRFYSSVLDFPGTRLLRGLGFGDTVFTAYREHSGQGTGLTYRRPPGRLYALESTAFVLFDVMCRSLARRTFESWNLNVFVFGEHDTLLRVVARNLGEESVRWGNAPTTARKVTFDDGATTFQAWIGPEGAMLRLVEPVSGLRAERDPPPARRAGRKSRPGS